MNTTLGRDTATEEGDTRVLHPLLLREGPTGEGNARGPFVGIAIDVETTGLDWKTGKIVELALRRFRYDEKGRITDIDKVYEWREDPGEPLTDEVSRLIGLTDADLAGRHLDTDAATALLCSASFVAAHNSAFDRRWVEERLPFAAGLDWCCSMTQVDWGARGFDGKALGYLLLQNGFYHSGHRASADVDAMIQMLGHVNTDGVTALSEMIERSNTPGWIVRARGAHFDVKDRLRARGYHWDPEVGRRVWWREISDHDLVQEQFWLAANVYAVECCPSALGPDLERIDAQGRFL